MKHKSRKIITLFAFVLVVLAFLFFKPKAQAPVVDTSMPPIENKDQVFGNTDDLIAFSISPNAKVHGILSYRGIIKGGYFFEANVGINILDPNKKILKASNAVAKTDWMTIGPVRFEGNIDFTGLSTGPAYFEIKQDDPSGGESGNQIKSILIPIIIE